MDNDILEAMTRCRKIIEEGTDIQTRLRKEGYLNKSQYIIYDKEQSYRIYREYTTIKGECNLCGETTIRNQPCFIINKRQACAFKKPTEPTESIYREAYKILCDEKTEITTEKRTAKDRPKCSFYVDKSLTKEYPIDITWWKKQEVNK
jgi:hypothetical protein